MSALPENFDSLSPTAKRAAVERATGLSWDEYSQLSGEQKTALLLSLKGYTYQSGTDEMLDAAQSDSFWNRIGGYFQGMGAGLKIALVLGVVIVVWLMLPSLKALPRRARAAA